MGAVERIESACGRLRAFGLLPFVLLEPAAQQRDGGDEVVAQGDEQVDIVEVLLAAEAVRQIISGVDGGPLFAAVGADEAEIALTHFGGGVAHLEGPICQTARNWVARPATF